MEYNGQERAPEGGTEGVYPRAGHEYVPEPVNVSWHQGIPL